MSECKYAFPFARVIPVLVGPLAFVLPGSYKDRTCGCGWGNVSQEELVPASL